MASGPVTVRLRQTARMAGETQAGSAGEVGTAPPSVAGAAGAFTCDALGQCGGDLLAGAHDDNSTGVLVPTTEWIAQAPDACQEPPTLVEPASACHELKILPDGSVQIRLPFPKAVPLHAATLSISQGQYRAHTEQRAPQRLSLPEGCLTTPTSQLSCQVLGRQIGAAVAAESNVLHLRCYEDGFGGCLCDYDLSLFSSFPGTWTTDGSVVTFEDGSLAPVPVAPSQADYCVLGDTLELTGHDEQPLFSSRLGIQALVFHRASCSDGVQSAGEEGVDCGGDCSPCAGRSPCEDGVQGVDEEGIDCGGSCHDLCACFNGAEDTWEEGVDCGGPCTLPCSCLNGVQDGSEEGIDCGGDCRRSYLDDPIICPQ